MEYPPTAVSRPDECMDELFLPLLLSGPPRIEASSAFPKRAAWSAERRLTVSRHPFEKSAT